MEKILTIAIPTYNRREYLGKALNSIYSQFDDRVEVIVSDNCSTDGTGVFVKNNYPQAIYYVNETNVGMENFKRCYDRATGKYMMLLGDDDVITEGSLRYIVDYLQQYSDLTVVFLNHATFKDNYESIDKCSDPFQPLSTECFVTTDRIRFMNVAKHQLTFISCFILRKEAYLNIGSIDKYINNSFFQTCIAFECMKTENAKYGYISKICIAQNSPSAENGIKDMRVIMEVFGTCEYEVFCIIGVNLGQNQEQMKKIYSDFICLTWPRHILSYKARGIKWREAFWSIGYPIARKFPKSWVTIIPAALIPSWFVRIVKKVRRK